MSALFLSLNCSEDLKQAKNPWVPTGLGYNWLTDVFTGWLHGSNCDNFCHAFFAYPCGLHTFFSKQFPRLSPVAVHLGVKMADTLSFTAKMDMVDF